MASSKSRGLFEVGSDEDSIATDTTIGSEANSEKEYEVERLLAQQVDAAGVTKYLVKWAGYPLSQCTWEPIQDKLLLRDWEKERLAVRRGEKVPFDVEDYNAAYEKWREELDEKKERRKLKRRRRGQPVDEDMMDFEPETSSPKRPPRAQTTTPARKGMAQPVRKGRQGSGGKSSESLWVSEGESSAEDSNAPIASAKTSAEKKRKDISPLKMPTQRESTQQSSAGPPAKKPALGSTSAKDPTPPQPPKHIAPNNEPAITGARKSAPAPTAKPPPVKRASTSNVFGKNWAEEKQPKQRQRVSGGTPKDSAAPPFRNLSIQNRYQKNGQNEPAPDPNALTMIDLKTGKTEPPKIDATMVEPPKQEAPRRMSTQKLETPIIAPPKTVQPARTGSMDIHSAYGRRSPPPAPKPRSPVLSRPAPVATGSDLASPTVPPPQAFPRAEISGFEPTSTKHKMCRAWLDGDCPYSADECWFAHTINQNESVPKRFVTCSFWKESGSCRKAGGECEYAHRDTGIYSFPPRDDTWRGRRQSRDVGSHDSPGLTFTSDAATEVNVPAPAPAPAPAPPLSVAKEPVASLPNRWVGKKGTTCYFWRNGYCNKLEADCAFAHYDTGIYAGEPGSYLKTRREIESMSRLGVNTNDSDPRLAVKPAATLQTSLASLDRPQSAPTDPSNEVNTTPVATIPDAATGANSIPVASFTTEKALVSSPVTEVTDHMASFGSISNANMSFISAAKDPRRQPRTPSNGAPANQPVQPVRTQSYPPHLLADDQEMARAGVGKLDFAFMLRARNGGIENVFIHMPGRTGEVTLLTKYFEKFRCKVLTDPIAWTHFRDTICRAPAGALLILHPSETFHGSLPGLNALIMEQHAPKIFSIGMQYELCLRENRTPAYETLRLFPHGGIYFISDDVFVYYPEKATEIINAFLEQTKLKPPGAETHKIGARPGIKDWLVRLDQQKYNEQSDKNQPTDLRWIACYEALCRLCPLEDEDPEYPTHRVPLDSSYLWSTSEGSLPSLKDRWESGDEKGATDYLANHFAGEACSKVWKYRRFFFVYERPDEVGTARDPHGWERKYSHVGVIAPDVAVKMLRKRSEASVKNEKEGGCR